jgi:phage protein D
MTAQQTVRIASRSAKELKDVKTLFLVSEDKKVKIPFLDIEAAKHELDKQPADATFFIIESHNGRDAAGKVLVERRAGERRKDDAKGKVAKGIAKAKEKAQKADPKKAVEKAKKTAEKSAPKSEGGVKAAKHGDDQKLVLLVKENPKRGSSAERYELYRKAKTVGDYLAAGGLRADLRWDEDHGYIQIG